MKELPIIMRGEDVRAILEGRKSQTRRVVKPQPPPQPNANCHPHLKAIHPAPYLDAYCGGKRTEKNPRGMGVEWCWWQVDNRQCLPVFRCPYGVPGDRLWVREAHAILPATAYRHSREDDGSQIAHRESHDGYYWSIYREGWSRSAPRWSPSIHMPRWASRLTLEIKAVRVERVQEISEEDARAEGCEIRKVMYADEPPTDYVHRDQFRILWDSITAKRRVSEWNGQLGTRGYGRKVSRIDTSYSWNANPWVWVIEFERVD